MGCGARNRGKGSGGERTATGEDCRGDFRLHLLRLTGRANAGVELSAWYEMAAVPKRKKKVRERTSMNTDERAGENQQVVYHRRRPVECAITFTMG